MGVMQSGTQMVKLKNGSKGLVRLFYLDEHRSCIRWRPSRKSEKAKITIDSLYKVTEGHQSDIFHRHAEGNFDPSCCFTIYHGNHMESLDLVTSNPEEARTWVTGLRYLMAGISDEDSLAKRQRTHDQYPFGCAGCGDEGINPKLATWMKQTFEEADKNGDGLLNIEEIYQLLHKINVNLPRRKVKQMFQEADTDDQQGTLTYEEFSVFYKMMSLRRDLYLLLMAYSNRKDHLTPEDLGDFLRTEQKMTSVTTEYCLDIINKFEVSEENKQKGVLGIEGFTNFMRSPTCDVFNPLHHQVNQDMDQPLCNYYIASSHNTYLTGDQLLSSSKTDMYAWVLQNGCRCVEVDCWDGPDGEPMVQHGYTLTSKITFKSVVETIDKYAFISNEYPVILSIENHCSVQQQKKMARYLLEIFGDKLDLGNVLNKDSKQLPSPNLLKGKILIKGKRLPQYLSADEDEGEVSDDDSADEIEDGFKLKNSNSNGHNRHQVESVIRKKLDSLVKESRIGDKEDADSFSIRALLQATHKGLPGTVKQNPSVKDSGKKAQSRSFISNLKQKRHSKSRFRCQSAEVDNGHQEAGQLNRVGRRRKTIKLSRDLSELVIFTNSIAAQDILEESTPLDVLSFSETRAQQLVHHQAERFISFNQRQLSRIYPSAYRIDSSNFNPQTYWNMGCQLVALNYQTEGRMMQLNRAKFLVNGNSGYVLKPAPMCKGSFNPFSDDPLPACPKKQLLLKIISGQQLPKPPDSMLGDRGEIIDPFVEVELIGLPVDCCKEQTRVVDDNGFNPVWEETLSFTLHMPELALVRFLVWDHDPIGRDFVGQRTVPFSSLMPGYRHVYLEGLTEASIFIHVTVHDIFGKWSPLVLNPSYTILHFLGAHKGRQLRGIKGLFSRGSRSCAEVPPGPPLRKSAISQQLLRRTASAPAKGRKKVKPPPPPPPDGEGTTDPLSARPPRAPLRHRPISMPLEKMLQGSLALTTSQQDGPTPSSDPPPEMASRERACCSSADLVIATSTAPKSQDPLPPSTLPLTALTTQDPASFHSGHGGTCMDTTSNSTLDQKGHFTSTGHNVPQSRTTQQQPDAFKLASDSAQWARFSFGVQETLNPTAGATVPQNISQCAQMSEASLQDSALSRLIDAVSLGNAEDTCGSISALIGELDVTGEQSSLPTGPNMLEANGHTFTLTPKKLSHSNTHDAFDKALLSSPETSDPAIYTILDEEVLSPISVNNLWGPSIQNVTVISEQNTLMGSPEASPAKALPSHDSQALRLLSPGLETQHSWDPTWQPQNVSGYKNGWDSLYRPPLEQMETPWRPPSGSANSTMSHHFLLCQDSVSSSLMEVEINVDEDPLEVTLTSPGDRPWWGDLNMPPCCQAVNGALHGTRSGSTAAVRTEQHRPTNSVRDRANYFPHGRLVGRGCELLRLRTSGDPVPSPPLLARSAAPSPCKSKSLGDLTSEDICCNFQSKYKFISRSFMTAALRDRKQPGAPTERSSLADPLTEQLRRLVSFDQDDGTLPRAQPPPEPPRVLSRKLSSRSQSRVRHIASRARERQQEASQLRLTATPCGSQGAVLRSKAPACHNPANRHSTGSYIVRYLERLEDRGLPEGSCTAPLFANGDRCWAGETAPPDDSCQPSEPEVYFLLRL
ncbi:1-phosphatidylinositol 4,5-bisphosphate phosphodiesterase eta-1-like [Arapaima gigas]